MSYHNQQNNFHSDGNIKFTLIFDNLNLNNNINNNNNSDNCIKHYYLLNNYCNYDKLIEWCKKISLLPLQIIHEIELEIRKYSNYAKLSMFSTKLDYYLHTIPHDKRQILGTILENLIVQGNPDLIEYTEQLHPDPHLMLSEIKITQQLPLNKSVVPAYRMCTRNRGVLFFVNIIHFPHYQSQYRSGAQHDKFYLINLFRKFGYKIYYYENLLLDTFLTLVNKLIRTHLNGMESLVFVVASHGNAYQEIEFYQNEKLNVLDILFKFSDRNCSAMVGKPKVFIFPCCRGHKLDSGIFKYDTNKNAYETTILETDGVGYQGPNYSDIIICYATIHGFVSKRCINNGNCYIEAFYRVLAEKAYELDLETMLYTVADVLDKICRQCDKSRREIDPEHKDSLQTPSIVRWDFNKLLYFNPGYFE